MDLHLCEPGDFDLCGIIITSYPDVEFEWLENGNSTNHDLCDDVFVSEATTFTLMVTATSDDNLITNGDFANGDDGSFITDYTPGQGNCFHGAGFLGCEGFYNILDDPGDSHTNFSSCSDFSGDGNMMVVNGASSLQEIWCQEVCVDPDASYLFSSWATSVNPSSPALLQFSIDGNLIGSLFGLNGTVCDWEQFEAVWQANGETSVEICVTNQNTVAGGNDFALDEIEFFQVCNESVEFEVTVSDLDIDQDDPELITCVNEESQIDIFIDSPFDYDDIEWDTNDGNITGFINGDHSVLVDEAGTYSVTVTDEFGCTFEENILVDEDKIIPNIELISDGILDCQTTEVEIEAISDGGDPEFVWEDENGVFLGDDDEISVSEPGTYFVTVTDEDNGCTNEEDIEIDQVIVDPIFDLLASNNLDCNQPSSLLTTSMAFSDVSWTAASGNIISETNDSLLVTQADTYFATVNISGCTHTDTITVSEIVPNFISTVTQETPIINCDNETSEVNINIDSTLFSLTWLGAASNFGNQTSIELNSAGTYVYQLTDSLGCTSIDSVSLAEDFTPPEVFATATELSCTQTVAFVTIDWQSNIVMIDEVIWTLPDGSSFSGGLTTSVLQPGSMTYTAFSAVNGCSTTDSIEVLATGDFPEVSVETTDITCNQPIATLEAESPDNDLTYEWLLPDGSSSTDQSIQSMLSGNYILVATALDGCATRTEHQIDLDTVGISLLPLDDIELNCSRPDTLISVAAEPDVTYRWTLGATGDIIVGTDLPLTQQNSGEVTLTATSANGCTTTQSFSIDQNFTQPVVDIEDGILTCESPSYQALWNVATGNIATVIWTLPSGQVIEDFNIDISEPGSYQIQFVSSAGCVLTKEINVTEEKDLPDFDITASRLDCNTTSSTINVVSSEPFQEIEYFSDTQSLGFGEELIVNSNGLVTVVVTDINGCTATGTVTPTLDTIPPSFSLTAPDLGCQVLGGVMIDTITLELLTNIQVSDSLDTILGDLSESITQAGTYTVTAIGENGCTGSATITIADDDSTVDFLVDPLTLTCGEPSQVVAIISLETYSSAELINSAGDVHSQADFGEDLIVSEEGTFTVVVTNTNGCTSDQILVVDLDVAEINFDVSATLIDCNNTFSDIELLTSENFSSAIILDQTDSPISTIDNLSQETTLPMPGTYTMQVTGLNGCVAFRNFTVPVDTITIDFELTAGLLQCNNEPVGIALANISDTFIEAWYNLPDAIIKIPITGNFEVPTTGIYEVTLRASNGCTNSQEVEVLQNQDIPEFSLFSSNTVTCAGAGNLNDLEINGGEGPYQIFIDGEETDHTPLISVFGFQEHSLEIIDANGCQLDTTFALEPLPELEAFLTPEISIIEGAELQLDLQTDRELSDLTIEWLPQEGLSCYDCANPFFIGSQTTEYTVLVTDQYGCETEVSIRISVEEIVKVYIPNVLNLTSGQGGDRAFTLYSGEGDIEIIEALYIYDRWGNLIFEGFNLPPNDPSAGWDGRRAGQAIEQGVYVYQARVRYSNLETEDFAGDVTLIK